MANFRVSAFADEICDDLAGQMDVLRRHDIRYVEFRAADGKGISSYVLSEAKSAAKRLQDAGIGISALGSPIGKIPIREDFAPHFDLFRHTLELAKAMDTSYVRMFSFYIPQDTAPEVCRDEVLERLSRMAEEAGKMGIVLLHENESHIYGDIAERCLDIFQSIASPHLAMTYDPSNFVQCGVDNRKAWPTLKPYVRYMHIKDSIYRDKAEARPSDKPANMVSDAHRPAGEGDGCLAFILSDLARSDFDGFLSIEPHLASNPLISGNGADKFAVACYGLRKLLQQL